MASNVTELRKKSVQDLTTFWNTVVEDLGIEWFKPYEQVFDDSKGLAFTRWFLGGKINITHNCVERHQHSKKNALLWEGDDGSHRSLTYAELHLQVNRAANALKALGIERGDTVGIVMPMVPEVVVQLFACLKIGAIAIPIFSGFGAQAIATRLRDADAKVLFTSDIALRRGKEVPVLQTILSATKDLPSLKARIIFRRGEKAISLGPNDLSWEEFVLKQSDQCETESLDSEAPSLILFTSGTTGKPKGVIHTHAGALTQIGKELRYAFNVDKDTRFFWFTDIGWMMGPWEMIGVTLFHGTLFLYEGAPDHPSPDRLWKMIEKYELNVLGISPTAIRLLMKFGEKPVSSIQMPSLKILGSTGEPWDPESYQWYFKHVGKGRCPVINISGGTEIIGCLLSPLPIEPIKPCSLGGPGLGVDADVFGEDGKPVRNAVGHLVCKKPIPSMTKGFLGSKQHYLDTYFSRWPEIWYHGDWAEIDKDGYFFLHGRSDDTIKIAGKRIGPIEFEASLLSQGSILEAAAIGVPDSVKGEVCVCFVVLKPEQIPSEDLRSALMHHVSREIGKALSPREIRFVSLLPKTRSAKILRGLVRKIYLGEMQIDTSSVDNLDSVTAIRNAI